MPGRWNHSSKLDEQPAGANPNPPVDAVAGSGHPAFVVTVTKKSGAGRIAEPVAVLGVGVEGRATIDYLLTQGATRVVALDRDVVVGLPSAVETRFGHGYDHDLHQFGTVFRAPGIRPDRHELTRAATRGTIVTSATSHFLERCATRNVVGVTGTVGKGTSASLIATLLAASEVTVHLGGNIGQSPLEFIDEVRPNDWVVLEISSFQAMDISRSPAVGVILKTTSEHLDWHRDTTEYRSAKANLVAHQAGNDVVVFNAESPGAVEVASASPARHLGFALDRPVEQGLWLDRDGFRLRLTERDERLPLDIRKVRLPGRFNLENIASALLVAALSGADTDRICLAAKEFEGLPHRLETVIDAGGVRFVNDSYATRPEATEAALKAIADLPLAIILGGSEKHAAFGSLISELTHHRKVVQVSLIGETAERIEQEIRQVGAQQFEIVVCDTLGSAVESAARSVSNKGVVLFSPACASFDMFPNYKVRGETFRKHAIELAAAMNS